MPSKKGMISSLHLLALFLVTQPGMLLALFAVRALCWLRLSSLSAKMPRGFSAKPLTPVKPQPAPLQGAHPAQVQDLALVLVDFRKVPVSTFLQPV